jgi:hypothetical protein
LWDSEGDEIIASSGKEDIELDIALGVVKHLDLAAKLTADLPVGTGSNLENTDLDLKGAFRGVGGAAKRLPRQIEGATVGKGRC